MSSRNLVVTKSIEWVVIQNVISPRLFPLVKNFNTKHVGIHRSILKFLNIVIFFIFIGSYQSQTVNEKDYLASKSKNENAALVLFPCFPCDKYHTQREAKFLENIENEGISVILLDFNQKLFLDKADYENLSERLNSIFDDHAISKKDIYMGGFSSGGNVSLLISNYLLKTKNQIQPKGIFLVDSPVDLEELYKNAKNDVERNKSSDAVEEGNYLLELFNNTLGNPQNTIENYKNFSPYLISQNSTVNIEHLIKIKTRFYTEPDLQWQSENRNRTYEDLNAYKLEKLYHALRQLGSKKTEFIKTINRGYQANGQRHPHSWNLVERESLVRWMLE